MKSWKHAPCMGFHVLISSKPCNTLMYREIKSRCFSNSVGYSVLKTLVIIVYKPLVIPHLINIMIIRVRPNGMAESHWDS